MDQMEKNYCYATAGVFAACATLCLAKPGDLATETFGESTRNNKEALHMYGPLGFLMAIQSATAFALAQGKDAATALFCGFALVPARMAFDVYVGTPPPKVMMGMVTGLFSFGLYNVTRKK